MTARLHGAGSALLLIATLTAPAQAQRVLDWPFRTTAGPESVVRGAEAVFTNPASIIAGNGRGEILVADQRTPDMIGISGFAAAASWRLDPRTIVAAGYQHVAIDDIGETSTSPLPDAGDPTFSVAEDQIAAGVSHVLGTEVIAGASVRYDRSNETGFNESTTSLGAGVLMTTHLPLQPVVGASLLTQSGGVRYIAGIEVASAITEDLRIRGGYGIRGGENTVATEHRIGATAHWRELVALTAGVATADAGVERSWEPAVGASLRISRYELGVMREGLASGFGAAYSFRFRFGLK